MEVISKIELSTTRSQKGKTEFLTLKMYEGATVFLNNQPIGGTPYEAIAVLKKAIGELEKMGRRLAAVVEADPDACDCLKRSLREKSELPYGCSDCMEE